MTIEAEKPRLAPHTEAMKQSLARLCGLDASCVAIAAGTAERLGFVGEGLGIVCYAAVMLKKL